MSIVCDRLELVRDYAFDEVAAADRPAIERHIAGCGECARELDQLRLTTASLRALPEQPVPQRIAFVSDKVFEPSGVRRFFAGFWNSAPRLGFASACVVAGALIFSGWRRPPAEIRTVVTASAPATDLSKDVSKQVNEAVARAVTEAVARVRSEDAELTKAALSAAERKHEQEHRVLLDAVTVLQSRLNTSTLLAADYPPRNGAGQ